MPNRSAITLLRVRGIQIGVDYSWFFVLFLLILWLSGFYKDVLGPGNGDTAYVLAVASALLFFASILLHELGHALVAMRKGIGITGITLWMFGGVARMDRDSDSPGTEFKVAVAGPLVTAAIAALCVAAGVALEGGRDFREAMLTNSDANTSAVGAMLAYLAFINILVLLFNLIPAFPLDGGRIARAVAWWRTGDRRTATRFAAGLGRGFAYLMMAGGLALVLGGSVFNGLWLIVIGFVLNGSARGALMQSEFTKGIEGLHVYDVMDNEPVAIPAELPVERAIDEYFLRYRWPWFPVVDENGLFSGVLASEQAENVPESERDETTIGSLLGDWQATAEGAGLSISVDSPLEAVLSNQAMRRLGALAAVDADGRLRGVLTADAVGRALRQPAAGA
ncbi:MAG: site-2 protease family protein [Solirubrobacterales bacterium]